jgi:predicted nucleotidyltransferase
MSHAAARRRPRESLLPKLAQVVARIERQRSYEAEWKNPLLRDRPQRGSFTVLALYAFGSFARGAPTCADLDLIVIIRRDAGDVAPDHVVAPKVKGAMPNVDLLVALEADLASKLEQFPETRLVWSTEARDWSANVAAIGVEPSAGHFARKTDAFPLSLKQLAFRDLEQAEAIVDRIEARELVSHWLPLDTLSPAPEGWPRALQRLLRSEVHRLGRASSVVLPYVLQWMTTRLGAPAFRRGFGVRGHVHVNGLRAHLGRPALDASALDRVDVSALVLAPHRSTRHPEGLWVLERGENHRCVKAFEGLRTWCEFEDGKPLVGSYQTDDPILPNWEGVELFSSRRHAIASAKQWSSLKGGSCVVPAEFAGASLLLFLSEFRRVCFGGEPLDVRGDVDSFLPRLKAHLAPPGPRRRFARGAKLDTSIGQAHSSR